MTAMAYIGTSGWNYPGWKDTFYAGIAKKEWLNYCAKRFTGIEVNATFYGLQKFETFQKWRNITPKNFRFTIKGNKYVTHYRKLNGPEEPVRKERERASGLGEKLAVVVWQLPRNLKKNMAKLDFFADVLDGWTETRHTIEFRHSSWFDEEVADCLERHRIAVCMSDAADWPMWDKVTTDLVYVRLHGHTRTYVTAYDEEQLQFWAVRARNWLGEGRDVHVYFDNDAEGAAPFDAMRLLEMVSRLKGFAGWDTDRR